MKKLVADYVNDPENDYDIMVEILSDDEEIAVIRKVDNEYKMIVYKTMNDVEIPLIWLKDVIQSLK